MSQSVRLISRTREIIRSLYHKFTQKCMFIERFAPKNLYMSKFFCTFAAAKLQMLLPLPPIV